MTHLEKRVAALPSDPVVTGKILFYGYSFFTRWGSPRWGYRRADEDIYAKDKPLPNQAGYDLYKAYFKEFLDKYL